MLLFSNSTRNSSACQQFVFLFSPIKIQVPGKVRTRVATHTYMYHIKAFLYIQTNREVLVCMDGSMLWQCWFLNSIKLMTMLLAHVSPKKYWHRLSVVGLEFLINNSGDNVSVCDHAHDRRQLNVCFEPSQLGQWAWTYMRVKTNTVMGWCQIVYGTLVCSILLYGKLWNHCKCLRLELCMNLAYP